MIRSAVRISWDWSAWSDSVHGGQDKDEEKEIEIEHKGESDAED